MFARVYVKRGRCLFISLRALSGRTQVRLKVEALRARRAELVAAIAVMLRAASALRARRGGVAHTYVSDSLTVADAARASGGGNGGGVTLASVERSLAQAQLLCEQFDRRWGFARDRRLGTALEVCINVCVCVCVCVPYSCSTSS